MDMQLTREEKENFLQQVADAAFEDALNKMDAAAILEICLNACKREMAEIEKQFGTISDVIQ